MRPVVEGMGLSWQGQHEKLAARRDQFNCQDILTVGGDGKRREMLCIPLRRYPMWLATINPAKIPATLLGQTDQPLGRVTASGDIPSPVLGPRFGRYVPSRGPILGRRRHVHTYTRRFQMFPLP